MSTTAEITALLTGPGAAFEVTRETIDGLELKVYKERFGSLREVAAFAAVHGDQPFIVHGDRRISFTDFLALANSVSATLAERYGVAKGDRVAVLSANNPEWCMAFWGTVDLGAILVGLNGWWKADEIEYGLRDSGAKVLVADARRYERIAEVVASGALPDLEVVFLIDGDPADQPAAEGKGPLVRRFDELTGQTGAAMPTGPLTEADPAVIFYTSGTTGRPKGAISTHRSMIANLQNTVFNTVAGTMAGTGVALAADAGDAPAPDAAPAAPAQVAALFTSPLFHVSGCHSTLVVGFMGGLKLVMPVGRFDPEVALGLIEQEQVAVWATVPTMVWRACEHPTRHDFDLSSVKSVAFGGSPSADELQRKIRETFPNVRSTSNAYGLTETSSVATVIGGQDALDKPTSVGLPMPTVEVRIDDGSGRDDVPAGTTGEVLIKGPILMQGYWNKPEATAEAIRDGWLHTGDVGHLDDEGYLFITDRAKDMIIRGGENVYCVEIENRLVEHPAIADAAIIGVPHPSLGEEVKAVVQVEEGHSITASEIQQWVAETLAAFKVPTYVDVTTRRLPRNASGKLLKNVLRGTGEVSFDETM